MARIGLALCLALLAIGACAHVQPHLALPQVTLREPAFPATLEALTGAPLTSGNSVQILLNGDEIFPAQLAAIRQARRSITYAQYFYEDGPIARDLAEALAQRCRDGLRVHVLLDGFGTLSMPAEYRETIERAGCQFAIFRALGPFTLNKANNRNHRRILVADGRIGFTGGSGASAKWMGNGRTEGKWRETDVRLEGPIVRHLQGAFAENWLEATGEVLGGELYFPRLTATGTVPAQVVRSSPAGGSYAMYTLFLLAISSARHSIHITNPYFVPDQRMIDALLDASRRGVRVVALLPGAIDSSVVRQAGRSEFGRLLRAGIQIHEYQAGLLHAKTMVVDGTWATVGSTNLDNRSFALNEELNLSVLSPEVAGRLDRVFADDLAHARRVNYEEWRRRGLWARLIELVGLPLREQM
jgi:cardiolipin synthase